ncbi:MAG: hypothetical protein AB2766_11420 [Candidatus Thiodiazotropha endolucinida]
MTLKNNAYCNYAPAAAGATAPRLDASPFDLGGPTFTLTITGIKSAEVAKEIAEYFSGSEMQWVDLQGDLIAYPSEGKFPATIVRVG